MLALISKEKKHLDLLQKNLQEIDCECSLENFHSLQDYISSGKVNEVSHVFIYVKAGEEDFTEIKNVRLSLGKDVSLVLVSDNPEEVSFKEAQFAGFRVILEDTFPKYRLYPLSQSIGGKRSKPEKEEYWDGLVNFTREFRCVLDSTGKIVYVNSACDFVVGFSSEELLGKQVFEFIGTSNLYSFYKNLMSLELYSEKSHILQFKHKKGHIVYLSVQFHKVNHDLEGEIIFFAQDVTKLVETQNKLNLSNNRWNSLVNNTPMIILITDDELTIQYINRIEDKAKSMGITEETLIGQNFSNFSNDEGMLEFKEFLKVAKQKGFNDNYIAEDPLSKDIYNVTATFMHIEEDQEGFLFVMNNITDEYRISKDLEYSKQRNDKLFQNNISGAIRVDQHGTILEHNVALQKILGLNNPDILDGENITSIMDDDLWRDIEQAISSRTNIENREINFSYNNNKFWLLLNATVVQVEGQVIAEISVKDISNLKEVIFQLKEQTDMSNQYQSMLLSTQLNPHFIFNALNSMQFYILNDNAEEGLEFVSDFSGLIRSVLQNSAHNLISIEEEVEFLNKYLVVEKHRMQGKLDYEIVLDPKINVELNTIPPMLIQPYVENTIVHGFTHKNGKGNLLIEFMQQKEEILVKIEDDGVGRGKADEMKKSQTRDTKKSMSMAINKNRLALLEKQYSKKFEVEVQDKVGENDEALGTVVVIRIPIVNEVQANLAKHESE